MKKIQKKSPEEDFQTLSKRLQKDAKKKGITRKDVEETIREVRREKQ